MQPELTSQANDGLIGAARALLNRLPLASTFVKFIIVGGIAYLVLQGAFFVFYDSPVFWFLPSQHELVDFGFARPEIRLLIATILAVEIAITFQFFSHERWTFRHREHNGWIVARFVKFNLSAIVSPIIIVVTTNTLTPLFGISPYVSNTIGVLIGFMWNWTLNTLVIWPRQQELDA